VSTTAEPAPTPSWGTRYLRAWGAATQLVTDFLLAWLYLGDGAGFDVVDACGEAETFLRSVAEHRPDLVVVDVRMPPTFTDEGVRAALVVREQYPQIAVLVLSQYVEEAYALGLVDQLAHTVGSPPVAYLLFVIGMALLLFELYTAGVGVAGVVGASFVLLGGYGLAVLPTNPWAVGLLVFAMFGFGIDVQTGVPRVWTGIAAVSYLLGSVFLYDGRTLSWITLLISVLGMVLAMLGGMPAMVRSRFSTPTIGREWMVGEEGVAATAVDPDGTVLVRDAPWRARTNRATPIASGAPVRVAAIDGLVLEVEPLDGAARDHRARATH